MQLIEITSKQRLEIGKAEEKQNKTEIKYKFTTDTTKVIVVIQRIVNN